LVGDRSATQKSCNWSGSEACTMVDVIAAMMTSSASAVHANTWCTRFAPHSELQAWPLQERGWSVL
jgi:hypothetical protein